MSKLILLNGPIKCGKNTAVDRVKSIMQQPVVDRRCKDHLFKLTQQFFCISEEKFYEHYNDRATKETPQETFSVSARAFAALADIIGQPQIGPWEDTGEIKLSVREALIYVSEVLCKPTFGKDYFGKALAANLSSDSGELSIDDSCGFKEEIAPVVDKLGSNNVLLIRILGRGSFDGDSRDYIPDGVVKRTLDVTNTGTEEEFLHKIGKIAESFYKE